ncbi:MAG TPA: TetR family transcriptional regulator [Steroidobacteraceae bacterium]|nr:TetR family transcriptional regulator [Steroidobacteraceae bacterium]
MAARKTPARNGKERNGKERILDAAEQLFAHRGFYGVSLRDITQAAGVDVALVGYHFGGKRELFTAVFERRAELLNSERLERLEAVRSEALPGTPALEAIIGAFTQPVLERSARGGPGWKSYFALVAYVNNSPEFGPQLMTRHFDPLVERFIEVMREALPSCPPREIYWGYQFLTGALTLTFAETGRIDQLSGGLCRASDLDGVHERLAPYVAAGMRALCARTQPVRTGKRIERRSQPRR